MTFKLSDGAKLELFPSPRLVRHLGGEYDMNLTFMGIYNLLENVSWAFYEPLQGNEERRALDYKRVLQKSVKCVGGGDPFTANFLLETYPDPKYGVFSETKKKFLLKKEELGALIRLKKPILKMMKREVYSYLHQHSLADNCSLCRAYHNRPCRYITTTLMRDALPQLAAFGVSGVPKNTRRIVLDAFIR